MDQGEEQRLGGGGSLELELFLGVTTIPKQQLQEDDDSSSTPFGLFPSGY